MPSNRAAPPRHEPLVDEDLDRVARELVQLDQDGLQKLANYWETVRTYYAPFESELRSGTAQVYHHEIPGGQYSNYKPQVAGLGLLDRW